MYCIFSNSHAWLLSVLFVPKNPPLLTLHQAVHFLCILYLSAFYIVDMYHLILIRLDMFISFILISKSYFKLGSKQSFGDTSCKVLLRAGVEKSVSCTISTSPSNPFRKPPSTKKISISKDYPLRFFIIQNVYIDNE